VTTTQVWSPVAEICVAPDSPATATGVNEVKPAAALPSWLFELLPQQRTCPPATSAHVWKVPAVISVAPDRPVTATGVAATIPAEPFPS